MRFIVSSSKIHSRPEKVLVIDVVAYTNISTVLAIRMQTYVLEGGRECEGENRLLMGSVKSQLQEIEKKTHIDDLNISSSGLRLLGILPGEDSTAILVELEGGDDDVAGVDADGGAGAVRLVPLHTLNVDDPLLAVHLDDLALTTLVLPSDNADFIIFADGDGAGL